MSVVAISPRPHPSGRADRAPQGRPDRAPTGRTDRLPPTHLRSTPTLTVTVELTPGQLTPRLARLVELLRELAESGEGTLLACPPEHRRAVAESWAPAGRGHPAEAGPAPAGGPTAARPFAVPPPPENPDEVRILAASRVVRQGSRVIPLTRIEFDLLHFLAAHPRRVFTRLQLLSSVWGYEHAVARTVDVHVRRLRAKLGDVTPLVTTVYGVGYRLADEARVSVDPHR
ncbi:DNA-binding response regulator MtrA [Micromonospora sp. MW-13]|uniref:winged helix-turn-helix domain-containing protein n=1 Tax=unclassified Micromonospora TaxID=2617518 RepID=UPI000E43B99B|nr:MULTISPECIES: winged helix-turn-helix domain-containing protein [unclassified Micromonospora]MCX4472798.1 winged helix-turn-helix domain-containing protein [Micromonospora sp. NBC_01655]RGC69502.1 DNA-binding response regulator MtrA [Micromonospora sp. MW-13]